MNSRPKRLKNPLLVVLGLSFLFFVVFMAVSGTFLVSRLKNVSSSGTSSSNLFKEGAVGLVELRGVIMDSKRMLKKLEALEEDKDVKAVVLRLDSPGGAVAPSQEIYEAVKKFEKPVVVSMSNVAASGAFYIAMGAKKIYANPGTITGSIGVIMEFANLEKLYDWAKIQRYSIKTGKFKDAGAEYRAMTKDEKDLFEAMAFDVLSQFKQAIADGRKVSLEEVTAIADGRIFSGNQAKALKMIDELGTLDTAIKEAAKMGGIKGKPRIITPERKRKHLWDELMGDRSAEDEEFETRTNIIDRFADRLIDKVVSRLIGSEKLSLSNLAPGVYYLWK